MNKTKIEWTDHTWNPIKGLCPVGCWYCYARKIYKRFGMNPKVRLNLNELIMPFPKKPSKIFVCSTFELFHPIADKWRDEIFEVINLELRHTFIILTKMPENIDRPMPPNVWLGISLTGEKSDEYDRMKALAKADALTKFVSFEPLLHGFDIWELFDEYLPDWIIVGRLTGHGTTRDVSRKAIEDIVDFAAEEDIPVFFKNNLREIWGAPLIQEFPKTP